MNCESCYTCEKGVLPTVTVDEYEEAKKKGAVPQEWILGPTSCERCYTCQKCNTAQEANCQNCFTCQKCYSNQTP
jgi:hypothetical protein